MIKQCKKIQYAACEFEFEFLYGIIIFVSMKLLTNIHIFVKSIIFVAKMIQFWFI